ncbi:MAG: 2-hydroxyacyl-CoA dehydratase family protein [Dehalococcoidales bacterium]|nr:2-hydroxyacyl-CoA dehydratase family protein [Dehalococcoidales bacterium]
MISNHWESLRTAKANGLPTVWSFGPIFFLSKAVGIPSHFYGGYASLAARDGGSDPMLEIAQAEGYLPDACSYYRLHMGLMAMLDKGKPIREDMKIPIPDLAFCGRYCTEMSHISDAMYRRYHIPTCTIDIPNPHEVSNAEMITPFIEQQIKDEIIPAIEKLTGKPYDYDALSQALVHLKRASQLRNECLELSKNIPAPWSLFDIGVSAGAVMHAGGTPESVEYYEKLKAELEERCAQKIGVVAEEKYRILYDQFIPWRWLGSFTHKMSDLGVSIITGRYPTFLWSNPDNIDPENPIHSIAEQLPRWFNRTTPEEAEVWIAECIEKYAIDGLFMLSSRTCRLFNIGQEDILSKMELKYGIPGVIVDMDQIDPVFYSEAQIDTRLGALLEMIDSRRKLRV